MTAKLVASYKGCGIWRSDWTTTVHVRRPHSIGLREELRPCYTINGKVSKAAAKRPFLTTVAQCKEWITAVLDGDEW